MAKKENITKKKFVQLSFEFPSSSLTLGKMLNDSTPVIPLKGSNTLCKKVKTNYINFVLDNTKSF